jgi:hypothetical protein
VASKLIELYSRPGDRVLDPFCGSGSLLVECLKLGRNCVGTDIDPLSVFVSEAKTRRYNMQSLTNVCSKVSDITLSLREKDLHSYGPFTQDIPQTELYRLLTAGHLESPPIPRLTHWSRHRCIAQLARLKALLSSESPDENVRKFLLLCFAAIIRNSSNADPVPVSGLEVTRHMRYLESAGREIDPYTLLTASVKRTLSATADWLAIVGTKQVLARVARADARHLRAAAVGRIDSVITSPPYPNAVDYYRRHQLETYWLGLVRSEDERRRLAASYAGRDKVPAKDVRDTANTMEARLAAQWLNPFPDVRPERARSFTHYCCIMGDCLRQLSLILSPGSNVIIVIGDGKIRGEPIRTPDLIEALASPQYVLLDRMS